MALQIAEHVSRTDVGRQRSSNEDALLETSPLFAVADGMGGARAGEVASGIAVDMLAAMDEPAADPEQRLEQAAQAANRKIFELAQADESRSGMGTTLTAAVFTDGHLAVAHVGDSRLYRWRDDELERLTRDHSLVEELVRRGELDPDDVESHPQRAIITRALGPSPAVEVETFTTAARADDVYLLCSDGLTTMVRDDRVAEIIRTRSSLDDAALRLVNTANENGGRDNVTVVLFRTDEAGTDDPLEDEHATRANLRVEDVAAAAAHERTAESPAVPEPRAARPERSRPRARLRTATTIFFVLLSVGVLIAGIWFGARQFYFLGENDQGVVTLFNGMPIDLPGGVSLYEPELVSEADAESIPPRQREVVLDERLRSRGDALGLIENLEREQRAGEAAAERARREQEARQRRESAGPQGGAGSGGSQGGAGASRPSGSGQN